MKWTVSELKARTDRFGSVPSMGGTMRSASRQSPRYACTKPSPTSALRAISEQPILSATSMASRL
jgi:hypothetical protein